MKCLHFAPGYSPRGLAVLAVGLLAILRVPAQTWVDAGLTNARWQAVAASANGSKLAAVYYAPGDFNSIVGGIWISTNAGVAWTKTSAPSTAWTSIAMSADGSRLIAGTENINPNPPGSWLCLSQDSGQTWTTNGLSGRPCHAVASSADGSVLAALSYGIYISTNSGVAWQLHGTNASLLQPATMATSIAMSADGTKMMTLGTSGLLVSTNSGTGWMTNGNTWMLAGQLACSADGATWFALKGSSLYVSTNLGVSWITNNVPDPSVHSLAVSADGTQLALVTAPSTHGSFPLDPVSPLNGPIYTSSDSGVTWASNNVPGQHWAAVACSADGNRLIAVGYSMLINSNLYDGRLWLGQTPPTLAMHLVSSGDHLTLSWTIPSTGLGMQESSDLASWTDLTNSPTVHLPNLRQQIELPVAPGGHFYRLKTAAAPSPE